jgi:hypothetical protein
MAAWPADAPAPWRPGAPIRVGWQGAAEEKKKGIRMRRNILGGLILGLTLCAGVAHAEKPVMVMIGSTPCFYIRANDGTTTPQQRADRIQDVFNKYLGGSKASFAVKPVGKKTGIFMNGDLTIAVTPEDAKTAKAKSVNGLATSWKALLARAFNETKAVK